MIPWNNNNNFKYINPYTNISEKPTLGTAELLKIFLFLPIVGQNKYKFNLFLLPIIAREQYDTHRIPKKNESWKSAYFIVNHAKINFICCPSEKN